MAATPYKSVLISQELARQSPLICNRRSKRRSGARALILLCGFIERGEVAKRTKMTYESSHCACQVILAVRIRIIWQERQDTRFTMLLTSFIPGGVSGMVADVAVPDYIASLIS